MRVFFRFVYVMALLFAPFFVYGQSENPELGELTGVAVPSGDDAAFSANFVLVEGGTFQMGSNNGDRDEKPVHQVTVKSFYMCKYEVTQKEWVEVMGSNPSYFKGDMRPVECVSWNDAVEYCNKRSQKEGLTPVYQNSGDVIVCDFNANGYRLPTEAEWEYAAKGGNKDAIMYEYSGSNSVGTVAWYDGNSGGMTHDVGTKAPNSLSVYDMSGNVWEWCWDWYGSYGIGAQTDPVGASSGSNRVARGGGWDFVAGILRSAYRGCYGLSYRSDILGFRILRPQV
ncbi:MAG TPA: formylglycine-generating enzyme family protein [Treponema sp.]|nr:formylglycine-generating enzyme family protein [Treponema sp.]